METYTLGAPRHAHGEQALWVFHDQAFALSDQIVLASAVIVVSANAIMEDGSRFHALELRCLSCTPLLHASPARLSRMPSPALLLCSSRLIPDDPLLIPAHPCRGSRAPASMAVRPPPESYPMARKHT